MAQKLKTPYADLLYPLSTEEFEALRASIRRDGGVRDPIVIDEDGNILDGHHRYQIKKDAPTRVVSGLSEYGKKAFVYQSNLGRRNLSPEQKVELRQRMQEVARGLKEEDNLTQQQIASLLGVSQQRVSEWLMPNTESGIRHKAPDKREKLEPEERMQILELAESGKKTQNEIAGEFGITQPHVGRVAKSERKKLDRESEIEQQRAEIASGNVESPTGLYGVISLDPPWPYGTKYDPNGRRAANPYPEMSLDQIAAIELPADNDCVLWLWTTHKFMRHSFALLDGWGFRDVSIVTWVKDTIKLGQWLRSQTEFCIMAVKGKPQVELTNESTVIFAKAREHSRKPDEFYSMVDSLCIGYKMDYFSREHREGWVSHGNDVDRF